MSEKEGLDSESCNSLRLHHPLLTTHQVQKQRFQKVVLTQFSFFNEESHWWIYTNPIQKGQTAGREKALHIQNERECFK